MPLTHNPVAKLSDEFPDWLIGDGWGFRKLPLDLLRAGCIGFVEADDCESLRAKLREQEELQAAVTRCAG